MAQKIGNNLDLQKLQILNRVIEKRSSAPSSPVEGQEYYNTTSHEQLVYNGTSWVANSGITSIVAASNKITINNTDPLNPTIDVAVANLIDDTQSTSSNIYSASKVDSQITTALTSVLIFKGVIDCSANPNYPAASVGFTYKVSVAGKIGGSSGVTVEVGDTIYCTIDNAGGTQASVGADFDIVQNNIDVNALAGAGLVVNGVALDVNVDDSSIEINADTIRVKASGITNAMLAGSIADSKLSTITTANKVSGSAVQLKSGSALADSTGLDVTVDTTTIENNAGTLRVKSSGIGATQLASDAVTTAKILNANVTTAKLADGAVTPAKKADKYAADFVSGDFSSGVLTIAAGTHGLGATKDLMVSVRDSSDIIQPLEGEIKTFANGNVTVTVTIGLEFNGRIVIMA